VYKQRRFQAPKRASYGCLMDVSRQTAARGSPCLRRYWRQGRIWGGRRWMVRSRLEIWLAAIQRILHAAVRRLLLLLLMQLLRIGNIILTTWHRHD